MIKNVNVNQLLFSDLLVREPVDEVNGRLADKRGKFILTGSRGCGKSTILGKREIDSLNTEHPAILTRFEGAGLFGTKDNKYFNKAIMQHYYEVVMCRKFLDYIREYYPELYQRKFGRLESVTNNRIAELDRYINTAMYTGGDINHKLFSGELLSEIVSTFRSGTGAKSLTLMIDRFDWTHNSDPRVQEILKNHFSMFEKVIITSDDPTITDKKRKTDLDSKGYEIVTATYSSDLDTVTDIVNRRFELAEETHPRFPIEDVTSLDFSSLIERSGGNLDTILESFMYAETLHKWDERKDVSTILEEACTDKVKSVKQLRKMTKPPKLHL